MKKKMLLLMACLLLCLPLSSWADPWLACDPMTPEVERIDISLNGQLITVQAASIDKETVPGAWLLLDLSSIVAGSYNAKAMAQYGTWGSSDWSADFLFVKPVINAPAGTRLEKGRGQ